MEDTDLYLPDGFDTNQVARDQDAALPEPTPEDWTDEGTDFPSPELRDALRGPDRGPLDEDGLINLAMTVLDGRPRPRGLDGAPLADGVDPEAPFGRFVNGKPRRGPKRERAPRQTGPSAPPRRAPGRPKTASKPSYAKKIEGLLQLPAAALALAGSAKDSPALMADGATISAYGPQLSQALGDLAGERPEFAAVLDKILATGPYSALLVVAVPMTLQILTNHKIMPPVEALGVRSREDLIAAVGGTG